jgi:hypothetical protein
VGRPPGYVSGQNFGRCGGPFACSRLHGGRLAEAVNTAEELEEAARLFLLIKDRPYRQLTNSQVAELERLFPKSI